MQVVAVDFETFYDTKAGYSIREQGTYNYTRDERFDPYLISVSDGTDVWAGSPKDFNWAALEGKHLVSHNAAFDKSVYQAIVWPNHPSADKTSLSLEARAHFHEWDCTANLAAYLCNRRSLLHASAHLLKVEVSKEVRSYADGKHWADIVADGKSEAMLAYARADAFNCWSLWDKFSDQWPEHERRLSRLTIAQCLRGFCIDHGQLQVQLLIAQTRLNLAEDALPWIVAGRKPTSPKAIAEECRKVGIPTPPVKSREGEDAFNAWEAEYSPKYQWVKGYSDYRVIKKYINTLETIKSRLHAEGDEYILPFDLLYFGAHTGRFAGGGGFNVQNLRKEPLQFDYEGRLIADPKKTWVGTTLDVRSLIIPRAGKRMIVCDLSQIEPRVLAWIVEDKAMLAAMAAGKSPYEAHARASMGWTGGDLKTENKELYLLAKIRVLGLGYGCGWEKFITIAAAYGIDLTEADPEFIPKFWPDGTPMLDAAGTPFKESGYGKRSKEIVANFRATNPLIIQLWRTLDDAFKASEGEDFEMVLPSGRILRYPEVRREQKAVADPENPAKISFRWVYTALTFDGSRNQAVRKPFYGGLLCENLIQATARDVFAEHLLALNSTPGVNVLFHVHDEAICEVDPGLTPADIERIMSRTPDWLAGCPVAAEASEVPHYKK